MVLYARLKSVHSASVSIKTRASGHCLLLLRIWWECFICEEVAVVLLLLLMVLLLVEALSGLWV